MGEGEYAIRLSIPVLTGEPEAMCESSFARQGMAKRQGIYRVHSPQN